MQAFCKKYPPRKTKDSVSPEDDDIMYHDPYTIIDGEDSTILGNDNRKVDPEEIKTLFLIVETITHYTQVLKTITLHASLEPEIREKCLQNEEIRLEYIKKIKKELLKIFSWGKSRTPYMSLCEEGGPFTGKTQEYTIQDALRDLAHLL